MLWSLVKIVLFIVAIVLATIGAGMLMETEGGVRIAFGGTEINLGPLQAVIAAIVLVFAVWLGIKLLTLLVALFRFLNGDETAISRYFDRKRERKGFQALSEGMMALASGEAREAQAKAARAEKFLKKPELTNLIAAQAAEMAGDKRQAEAVYKRLLADERTRFVGVRGLLQQKLAEGDTDTAMKLAEKAFALKPRHGEIQDTLLRLQADKGDWKGARKTLSAKLKYGALPRDVYRRRDAVLALGEARDVVADGKSIKAREAAIEANRLSPDLVPAAVMAARSYIKDGKPKYAARVLTKAWASQPHPDLAAAFADIVPDETPEARLKRFRTLIKHNPDVDEARMLLAELNIAAGNFEAARKAMGDLAERHPSQRALTLMAAIERGEGADDSVVRAWLARAVTAPRGPQWVCANCNHIQAEWAPVCEHCGSFDTLSWKVPQEGQVALTGGADMLPLIVAAPNADTQEDTAEDQAAPDDANDEADKPGNQTDNIAPSAKSDATPEIIEAELVEADTGKETPKTRNN